MEHSKIIKRIQALLRLAGSSNEYEAAEAAAKAQELLQQYNLDEDVVINHDTSQGKIVLLSVDYVSWAIDLSQWEVKLASEIAPFYFTRALFDKYHIWFLGRSLDTQVIKDVFVNLRDHLLRLSYRRMDQYRERFKEIALQQYDDKIDMRKVKKDCRPSEFRRSYLYGTITGVVEQLTKKRREFIICTDAKALVVNRDAELEEHAKQYNTVNLNVSIANEAGRKWGTEDGQNITIARGSFDSKNNKLLKQGGK